MKYITTLLFIVLATPTYGAAFNTPEDVFEATELTTIEINSAVIKDLINLDTYPFITSISDSLIPIDSILTVLEANNCEYLAKWGFETKLSFRTGGAMVKGFKSRRWHQLDRAPETMFRDYFLSKPTNEELMTGVKALKEHLELIITTSSEEKDWQIAYPMMWAYINIFRTPPQRWGRDEMALAYPFLTDMAASWREQQQTNGDIIADSMEGFGAYRFGMPWGWNGFADFHCTNDQETKQNILIKLRRQKAEAARR